ncbi:hypothetical protein QIS99_13310 [Streptomyces sp. B-S-A8]|uniref:Lipoprotein n=1 Tax=Streptomyces solicavernae TaxID=3043614 RepID=A0ABT6RRU6_9ACTN|nr:hypothetical protein [Streptomyces sp. B-S-A8]MDI3387170.1 hypothetical protein [Streptomyces sp. B-S-A8]
MAGRAWCRRVVGAALAAVLLGTSCSAPAPRDSAATAVEALLERRAEAVLGRDEEAYAATGGPGAEFDHLAQVPLHSWTYRLIRLDRTRTGATATAALDYRIAGHDRAPVTVERTLDLRRRDGRWYVAAERPGPDAGEQLWEQGAVTAVRGERSLVLGVGQGESRLRRYADLADRAVPAVQRAWGRGWPGRVVVLVPDSTQDMADLLGASASSYQGIAAVTTGESGGGVKAPADRVIVNPESYDLLGDLGQQVVLTHETTHVATRAATSDATPLWLSEGFADWVGYRGTGRAPEQAAPEVTREVRAGRVPQQLPDDAAFGFAGDAGRLARAYESGWLACRMIAERHGESALVDLYRKAGAHPGREGAMAEALRDVLGLTPEAFTRAWQDYLRRVLG